MIERNARMNGLGANVLAVSKDIREMTKADIGGECDSVVSNPPYMKAESGKVNLSDEMNDARRENNGGVDEFCACAARLLKFGGYFTVVYKPERTAELIYSMKNSGIEPKRAVMVYPSAVSKPCLVLIEGKKGAAEGMVFARPLIIYKDGCGGEYTDAMNAVYDNFTLEHLFK